MVYSWRAGFCYKANPEDAAKVMEGLAEAGQLNASNLVEVSRPEDAPLHDDFEWNDTKAAENWRKQQGRNMINSLIMIPEEASEEKENGPIRAFFKTETLDREQYQSTQVLIRTENGRDALIAQATKELISYRQKYRTVLEWTNAGNAINQALDSLERNAEHDERNRVDTSASAALSAFV